MQPTRLLPSSSVGSRYGLTHVYLMTAVSGIDGMLPATRLRHSKFDIFMAHTAFDGSMLDVLCTMQRQTPSAQYMCMSVYIYYYSLYTKIGFTCMLHT